MGYVGVNVLDFASAKVRKNLTWGKCFLFVYFLRVQSYDIGLTVCVKKMFFL